MHIRLNTSAESPQPGSWLAVEAVDANDQQLRILAKVVNSWEHNPHEDAQGSAVNEVIPFPTNYAPEGESTIIYRIAEVEPVKEVVLSQGEIASVRRVNTLPRSGALVYLAEANMIEAEIDNKNQENLQPRKSLVGKLISLPGSSSPSFVKMHVRMHPSAESPQPGSWLAVEATNTQKQQILILTTVVNSWEHNPHEDAQGSTVAEVLPFPTTYALEGESTVIYRIAEVEPIEEAVLNERGEISSVQKVKTLPRAGASVHLANPNIITAALGLEDDSQMGLELGTVHATGKQSIPIILNRSVIQRHIFIGGGIGSGKSYTRGVIAEELHMLGVPQINIDPNGEMVEATEQLGGINLVPGKNGFTLPLSALNPDDVIDAIPGMRSGTNYETLIRYAHEALLKENTLSHGEYFTVRSLVNKIEEVAPDLDMDNAKTLKPAMQRAKSLEKIPYIGEPYNWKEHIQPGVIINIDCRGLLVSDLRLIVASIARDLQRLSRQGNNLFVAFSIDEFHLVAPNDDKSVTTQVLREIARIGRHYKIGLILTTQSPQDVDRSILKRLLTRFLHSIEPDQLDALRGIFSDASEALIKSLPKLPQGVCILTGVYETIRHATVVDIRKRLTAHGGKTPDIWTDFANKSWSTKRQLNLGGNGDNGENV
ncbi:ATP-binding protein [Nostoc sp.]